MYTTTGNVIPSNVRMITPTSQRNVSFRPVTQTPKELMKKRVDTYRLTNPSPITFHDKYSDIEMGGPKSSAPIRTFSPIISPYMSQPYIQNKDVSRSYSPLTSHNDYMKSLDDSNIKYDPSEWGIHTKDFSGGKRRRLTKKHRKSNRISRTKRIQSRRRKRTSKTRK